MRGSFQAAYSPWTCASPLRSRMHFSWEKFFDILPHLKSIDSHRAGGVLGPRDSVRQPDQRLPRNRTTRKPCLRLAVVRMVVHAGRACPLCVSPNLKLPTPSIQRRPTRKHAKANPLQTPSTTPPTYPIMQINENRRPPSTGNATAQTFVTLLSKAHDFSREKPNPRRATR
jgi:hypothetical protein